MAKDFKTPLCCSLQNKCFLKMGVSVDKLQEGTAGGKTSVRAGPANVCTEEVWILKENCPVL